MTPLSSTARLARCSWTWPGRGSRTRRNLVHHARRTRGRARSRRRSSVPSGSGTSGAARSSARPAIAATSAGSWNSITSTRTRWVAKRRWTTSHCAVGVTMITRAGCISGSAAGTALEPCARRPPRTNGSRSSKPTCSGTSGRRFRALHSSRESRASTLSSSTSPRHGHRRSIRVAPRYRHTQSMVASPNFNHGRDDPVARRILWFSLSAMYSSPVRGWTTAPWGRFSGHASGGPPRPPVPCTPVPATRPIVPSRGE
jgi:hypothetical protein